MVKKQGRESSQHHEEKCALNVFGFILPTLFTDSSGRNYYFRNTPAFSRKVPLEVFNTCCGRVNVMISYKNLVKGNFSSSRKAGEASIFFR
jgi:hypothetical protein